MTNTICKECEEVLDEESNCPLEQRKPCPKCGSVNRHFNRTLEEKINILDGIRLKARHGEPGQVKPHVTSLSEPNFSHDRRKFVHRVKTEDRENYKYFEEVKDYETGETIHRYEEPLSQHTGHGSAKQKKKE